MGRRLYETQPAFRQVLERCNDLLRPYLAQPLLSVLYPENGDTGLLDQTAYTQPALFALEYALASLWQSWGVHPALVMGHSVGEYAAACLAGVFSLEDGLKLIAERGRLMQALPAGGEMAAVFADEAQVRAAVAPYADRVAIAAINGPENVVISGAGEAVRAILESLTAGGVKAQRLVVSHAFHSPLMEPMLAEFGRVAASISYAAPQIGLISNLSGGLAGPEVASAAYWQQHVRAPVLFAQGMQALGDVNLFLEIGPKPTLLGLGRRFLTEQELITLT
jgi:acyl transferase domain-containing protein